MSTVVKLGINCLVVTGLTVTGILAFAQLPEFTLIPLQWAGQTFEEPFNSVFWFVYTVLVWAVVASLVAWCMLYLKPGNVVLYGLVSAAAFIVASQSWTLASHAFGYVRELVLVLTIPLLYWAFVHQAGKRYGKS